MADKDLNRFEATVAAYVADAEMAIADFNNDMAAFFDRCVLRGDLDAETAEKIKPLFARWTEESKQRLRQRFDLADLGDGGSLFEGD